METTISDRKIKLIILRDNIEYLENDQRFLKDQRKSVNITGERLMSKGQAFIIHRDNKKKLRLMYAAYGFARGKKASEIENKYPEENHPLKQYQSQINEILDEYEL